MVAFNTVKPGDLYYETKSVKQGNTTLTERIAYRVRIVEVHKDHVIAVWNNNAPVRMSIHRVDRWTRTPPKGTAERKRFDEAKARAAEETAK